MEDMVRGINMENLFGGIYKGKTVLVTGHTGFKGSWLAYWLSRMGAKVIGYSLKPPTDPNHISLLDFEMKHIEGDILDREKLTGIFEKYKPEIVFHLAAQAIVRRSYQFPVETFTTNVTGTINVLEAARAANSIRAFIAVTSDKVYENNEVMWGYRETDRFGGFDPYSASKGCAEIAIASYRRSFYNPDLYGQSHSTLIGSVRAGNVIGGGDWAPDRLIPDIMRACKDKETVIIRNPMAIRPWQHVLECLSGYLLIGEKLFLRRVDYADGWNFGPPEDGALTVLDVVSRIQDCWPDLNYRIESDRKKPHEARFLRLDSLKARSLLGWHPVWDAGITFEKTTVWYRLFYNSGKVSTGADLESYVESAKAKDLPWTK